MAKTSVRTFDPFFAFRVPSFMEDWPVFSQSRGLDVYETDNEVVVKASLPGIPRENINIVFEDGVLRISGSMEEKEEEKKRKKIVHQSQMMTAFDYAATLPRAIKYDKIEAELDNGVLTITAPLAPEAKPKRIEIKANGEQKKLK